MKKSFAFLMVLTGSAILSAVLLPFADALLVRFGWSFDLHRVFSRLFLILLLIGFGLFSNIFQFKAISKPFVCQKKRVPVFFYAFTIGAVVLIILTAGAMITKVRVLKEGLTFGVVASGVLKSFATGFIVGFFETLIMWGIFFIYLKQDFGKKTAVLVTSFFYAFAHFMRSRELIRPEAFDPFIGFKVLGASFLNLANFSEEGFAMAGLLLLGIFFSLLFVKTGYSFYAVAGVHAGAVFMIKLNRVVLGFLSKDYEWLFGTSIGIDSVAGWTILILLIIYLLRKKEKSVISQCAPVQT